MNKLYKKSILFISFIFCLLGVALIGYGIGQNHPITTEKSPMLIERCEKSSDSFKLQFGVIDSVSVKKEKIWKIADTIQVDEGRHKGEKAIPLTWFFDEIGKGRALEIQPCSGNPIILQYKSIINEPSRYVLTRSDSGKLKLMDLNHDLKKPMMKNLHLFRVIPSKGKLQSRQLN